ncbi:MAG: signal peptide peptidase SppA [Saprospiraceae bacterium]|nr:signal peptide peptidase SppA [Saprospiraceae bacterium]
MKNFFSYFFASILGTIVALFVLGGILVLIGISSMAQFSESEAIQAKSVLKLDLDEYIPEQTNNISLSSFDFSTQNVVGIHDLITLIKLAKNDSQIEGIYITATQTNAGMVKLNELRDAIIDFKTSGKFVVAYAKYYTQGAYYLASAADEVYLNPLGLVDFRGFSGSVAFYKNMLDKIGVKVEVFYAGDFKGATEPYRLTELSPENRSQLQEYLNHLYNLYLEDVSASRNISVDSLRAISDRFDGGNANTALSSNLIDSLLYNDQVEHIIKQKIGLAVDDKLELVDIEKYQTANPKSTDYKIKDVVAVVYAEGSIIDGQEENGIISDEPYVELAKKLEHDDKVKAVVLRVNSPGGSAMASENIWRAFKQVKAAGKPIVISMGDYAASGGYYIAAAGDKIFAEDNTLTGSIGVFRIIPNLKELMNDKIGITYDTVKTGNFSAFLNPYFDISSQERQWMQNSTEQMYQIFLSRVAEARNMPIEKVHEIAQGRIWTATRAKSLGLVDEIGNLEAAIKAAATLAHLDDNNYRTREFPSVKEPFQQLIDDIFNVEDTQAKAIRAELGDFYTHYEMWKTLKNMTNAQARLPLRSKSTSS